MRGLDHFLPAHRVHAGQPLALRGDAVDLVKAHRLPGEVLLTTVMAEGGCGMERERRCVVLCLYDFVVSLKL